MIRYAEHPGPAQSLHPSALDPAKEIRFIGGFFASINAWHERWFGLDRSCPLEVNTSRGVIPLMEHSDYWAICPMDMALDLSGRCLCRSTGWKSLRRTGRSTCSAAKRRDPAALSCAGYLKQNF